MFKICAFARTVIWQYWEKTASRMPVIPFSKGLWSVERGELSDPSDLTGEVWSALWAVLTPKEGTNSTAFTFNVENLAVTSAESNGELSAPRPASACCSQESGAVLFDMSNAIHVSRTSLPTLFTNSLFGAPTVRVYVSWTPEVNGRTASAANLAAFQSDISKKCLFTDIFSIKYLIAVVYK